MFNSHNSVNTECSILLFGKDKRKGKYGSKSEYRNGQRVLDSHLSLWKEIVNPSLPCMNLPPADQIVYYK